MSNYTVSCPKCHHSFEPTDAIREEVEKELRGKMTDWQKKKEDETNQLLADQKLKIENELSEQLKKSFHPENYKDTFGEMHGQLKLDFIAVATLGLIFFICICIALKKKDTIKINQ